MIKRVSQAFLLFYVTLIFGASGAIRPCSQKEQACVSWASRRYYSGMFEVKMDYSGVTGGKRHKATRKTGHTGIIPMRRRGGKVSNGGWC